VLVTSGFAAPAAIMVSMLDGAEERASVSLGKKRL
jgi:hypothetical protein